MQKGSAPNRMRSFITSTCPPSTALCSGVEFSEEINPSISSFEYPWSEAYLKKSPNTLAEPALAAE